MAATDLLAECPGHAELEVNDGLYLLHLWTNYMEMPAISDWLLIYFVLSVFRLTSDGGRGRRIGSIPSRLSSENDLTYRGSIHVETLHPTWLQRIISSGTAVKISLPPRDLRGQVVKRSLCARDVVCSNLASSSGPQIYFSKSRSSYPKQRFCCFVEIDGARMRKSELQLGPSSNR